MRCAMILRRHRAGDAGVSLETGRTGLSGRSVRPLVCLGTKARGRDIRSTDERAHSNVVWGAGAPEPNQGRAGRSRRHRARHAWTQSGRGLPISPAKVLARPSCTWLVFERDLETIGKVALDYRVSVGASAGTGLGLARALVASGRVNRTRRMRCPMRRSAAPRPASPAVVRRRHCSRSPSAGAAMPVLHLDPDRAVAGLG